MKILITEQPNYNEKTTFVDLDDKNLRTVIFKDNSGRLTTVNISTIKQLVERYTEEYLDSNTRHIKGYKDRSWGI